MNKKRTYIYKSTTIESLRRGAEALQKQVKDKDAESEDRMKTLNQLLDSLLQVISDGNGNDLTDDAGRRYLNLRVLGFGGKEENNEIEKEYNGKCGKLLSLWYPEKVKDPSIKRIVST